MSSHSLSADHVPLGLGRDTHTMKIDSLRAFYTRDRVAAATSDQAVDQVVRSFLLYLLGTTLFADAASSLDLVFFMPLRDLDRVSSFDWGSCALAFLYRGMDDMVRWARRLCGFWHAVLVCFLPTCPFTLSYLYIATPDYYPFCRFGLWR